MWTRENISPQIGKTAIITGANSGLGFQMALELYRSGAHVIVASRNQEKAESAIREISRIESKGSLEAGIIDLSNLNSVGEFVLQFSRSHPGLDLLINNATVGSPPMSKSENGFELQFAVNFLGHFALTGLLYPLIRKRKRPRIVTVTSLAYAQGQIDFENLKIEKTYDAQREYNQSKLADLLFTVELQRRLTANGEDILSVAAHPGVTETGLARNMNKAVYHTAVNLFGPLMSIEQGVLSILYAATSEDVDKGCLYGPDKDGGLRGYPAKAEIEQNAMDKSTANRLWKIAEEITRISFPQL